MSLAKKQWDQRSGVLWNDEQATDVWWALFFLTAHQQIKLAVFRPNRQWLGWHHLKQYGCLPSAKKQFDAIKTKQLNGYDTALSMHSISVLTWISRECSHEFFPSLPSIPHNIQAAEGHNLWWGVTSGLILKGHEPNRFETTAPTFLVTVSHLQDSKQSQMMVQKSDS